MQLCTQPGCWFASYLCVSVCKCVGFVLWVCWRGVWEGHHCGRIMMEIPNSDLTAIFLCHCCLSVQFFICFYPLLSPHDVAVCYLDTSLLLQTTLGTSDIHLEYHHHISSFFFFFFWIETRELLVLLKSEFQMAVVSCTVALEVVLKQRVCGMKKALMEIKQATEHEILKMQICNEFNSILCVLYDPSFCCELLWRLTAASVVST